MTTTTNDNGFLLAGGNTLSTMPEQNEMQDMLSTMQDGKIGTLKEAIHDIETMIKERQAIQKEVFRDIDTVMMGMTNFLNLMGEKIEPVKQAELKEKLLDVDLFKLNEKVNAFKDIAALKKELRERQQECNEKEQSAKLLGSLMA